MKKQIAILLIMVGMLIGAGSCEEGYTPRTTVRTTRQINVQRKLDRLNSQEKYFREITSGARDWKLTKLVVGMTKTEFKKIWDYVPLTVNRTTGSYGVHEQRIFGLPECPIKNMTYIYFENGILTSWQN